MIGIFMQPNKTSNEVYKQLFSDIANIAIYATDENRVVCEWNKACEDLYGYTQEEAIGKKLETLIVPEHLKEVYISEFQEAMDSGIPLSALETEYRRKDYSMVLVNANTLFIDEKGAKKFYAFTMDISTMQVNSFMHDIVDKDSAQKEKLIVISFDTNNKITAFNAFAEELTGYKKREVLGRDFVTVFVPENYQSKVRRDMQGLANDRRAQVVFDFPIICKNGDKKVVKWEKSLKQKKRDEDVILLIGVDFTGDEKLEYLANYDSLTDLPNKNLLLEKMQASINKASRLGENMVTLFLNIENFKTINQTFGYSFGDKLLQTVSERMCSKLRDYDTVARFSGDEFVLVFDNISDDLAAGTIANRVAGLFEESFKLEGHELFLSADIGLSFFPSHGNDVKTLLKHANLAMLKAREDKSVKFQIFKQEMNDAITDRVVLETSLKKAIQNGEFFVEYQPQVDARSKSIVGAEALVRWAHPELKTIPPLDFIPIAEDTGMILEIGQIVLKEAITQAKAWHDAGHDKLKMSVNISAVQLLQSNLLRVVDEILEETGFNPEYLELELTESTLMHNMELAIQILKSFKERGIKIAIDDFGTGYSSFGYLSKLPLDCLKIDQSFVRNLSDSHNDRIIVSAINAMAHSLSLGTVVEGVEESAQYEYLKNEGCDIIQGYYFSKPVSAKAFEALMVDGIYHDNHHQEHFDYEKEEKLKAYMQQQKVLFDV
jgi:diguanylate cyclase (GGDEF)-like protein/PAS domain S-box-containing protein